MGLMSIFEERLSYMLHALLCIFYARLPTREYV
jgi:hypothetical protein